MDRIKGPQFTVSGALGRCNAWADDIERMVVFRVCKTQVRMLEI